MSNKKKREINLKFFVYYFLLENLEKAISFIKQNQAKSFFRKSHRIPQIQILQNLLFFALKKTEKLFFDCLKVFYF